jgi:hypothetical protein
MERLLPGGVLQNVVLTHHGFGQPVRAGDKLMDVPAFDAQFALVHRTGFGRKCPNDFPIEDLQKQSASTSTIRAETQNGFEFHLIILPRNTFLFWKNLPDETPTQPRAGLENF